MRAVWAVWLLMAAQAAAQGVANYREIEGGLSEDELGKRFAAQLKAADLFEGDAELFKRLLKRWQQQPPSERTKQRLRELLSEQNLTPEQLRSLQERARRMLGGARPPKIVPPKIDPQPGVGGNPGAAPVRPPIGSPRPRPKTPAAPDELERQERDRLFRGLTEIEPKDITPPKKREGASGQPVTPLDADRPQEQAEEPKNPEVEKTGERWKKTLEDWLGGPVDDIMPEFDEMFEGLFDDDALNRLGLSDAFADLGDWGGDFGDLGSWLGERLDPSDFDGPSVSGFDLPSVGGGGYDSLPDISGGGSPLSNPWIPAAVLGGIALIVVAVAFAVRGPVESTPAGVAAGKRGLGPWPVDPRRVRTAGELITAFEYLAMLKCGESARSANHLEVGDRLAAVTPSAADDARALAGLYEQARYTPAGRKLPAGDVERGRRHLLALTGAAGS